MKLSVSLPDEDLEFLDHQVRAQIYPSRSAALHAAVRMLKSVELVDAYTQAFGEWSQSPDAQDWEHLVADGMSQ